MDSELFYMEFIGKMAAGGGSKSFKADKQQKREYGYDYPKGHTQRFEFK